MKRTKRLLSLIVMLLVLLCPAYAYAQEPEALKDAYVVDHEVEVVDTIEPDEIANDLRLGDPTGYWAKYASPYFYHQLSGQYKNLYDSLNALCMNYMISDIDGRAAENKSGTGYIAYSGLTYEETVDIAYIFIFSNPQYYFLNDKIMMQYSGTSGYISLGMYPDYVNGTARESVTAQVRGKLDSWNAQVAQKSGQLEKEKEIYDIILNYTQYQENEYDQSCVSLILYQKTVCAGYAKTFEMLCNAAGIDAICITSSTHAWNKANIEGAWYNADCTFDDTVGNSPCYDYFNKSDDTVQKNNSSHYIRNYWSKYTTIPICFHDYGQAMPVDATTYQGVNYAAVYDYNYYLENNPDVYKALGTDPSRVLKQFVSYGMNEARRASSDFDVVAYRAKNADVRAAYGTDWKQYYLHYIKYGKNEGRIATGSREITSGVTVYNGTDYAAVYNYKTYLEKNGDVAAAYGNDDEAALEHFVNYGMSEGRVASNDFDVAAYRAKNADVRSAYGTDWKQYYLHYMFYGKNEGRSATGSAEVVSGITVYNGMDYAAVYDYKTYLEKNEDVAAVYGNDDMAVLEHFVNCGMSEGRVASNDFDVNRYRAYNKDIEEAYGNDLKQYYLHYLLYGKQENRRAK